MLRQSSILGQFHSLGDYRNEQRKEEEMRMRKGKGKEGEQTRGELVGLLGGSLRRKLHPGLPIHLISCWKGRKKRKEKKYW